MRPLIFLSFANQMDDYLATLKRESQNINNALKELHDQSAIEVYREESVEIHLLLDGIKRFRERITIFHYAGHAGNTALQFEDSNANAKGLAQLLGELPSLQLVVLNGCSTQGQVDYLLQQGVKAVIATNSPINDTKATEFATEFYSSLAKHHTVEIAFKFAVNALKTKYGGEDMATIIQFRGFGAKPEVAVFPWGLYLNDKIGTELLNWGLPSSPQTQYTKNTTLRLLTNPPFNSDFFLGRDNDLKAIETNYKQNNRLLVLVNGEGGIGKTTLTAQYWYAHQARYKHLAWLYADTGIGNALITLKEKLGVVFEPNDTLDTQVQHITEAINNLESPCLLIFDNANNDADLKQYYALLNRLSNCHILITSRVRQLDNIKKHEVKALSEEDVTALFKHYYPDIANHELTLLRSILDAVGYNTLVTEVLAKNLAVFNQYKVKYSLSDLLKDLQEKGLLAVKNTSIDLVYGSEQLHSAEPSEIIMAMYDLAQLNERESYILNNLAVLPAENIAYELLESLLGSGIDKLDETLRSLEIKGWIEYRKFDGTFKISPVIQEVVRVKNTGSLLDDCRKLVDNLTVGLNSDNRHIGNYQQATIFAHLGFAIVKTINLPNVNLTYLLLNIGDYNRDIGNTILMADAYQRMINIQSTLCAVAPNNDHYKSGLATSHERLGHFYYNSKDLDSALKLFNIQHEIFKGLYARSPNSIAFKDGLATSYQNIALIYVELGNTENALAFFDAEYKLFEELQVDFPNNPRFKYGLASSCARLGNIHSNLNHFDKALFFLDKGLILIKKLCDNYPNNVSFRNGLSSAYESLGVVYYKQEKWEHALVSFENQEIIAQKLYDDYPNNVSFKCNLGCSYSKMGEIHSKLGNFWEAVYYWEMDLKLTKELHSEDPNNIQFKNELASSYANLGIFNRYEANNNIKAKSYLLQAAVLWNELVSDVPQYIQFKQSLDKVQQELKALE